eukprot:SAG22_NODE_46_length_24705_cov_89.861010_5_plen_689_part_00
MPTLQRQWKDFKLAIVLIRDVCMYLDRTWVDKQPQPRPPQVFELGLALFRDTVVRDGRVGQRLLSTMLDYVKQEREGRVVPRDIAKTVVDMMCDISLAVYREDFELAFLRTSEVYYEALAQKLGAESSCCEYMVQIERKLLEERERVEHYLHDSTMPKILGVVQTCAITAKMAQLFGRGAADGGGLVELMLHDQTDDLRRAYRLLKPAAVSGGIELLCRLFSEQVVKHGTETVQDAAAKAEPVLYIEGLLQFKRKYDRIVTEAFRGDRLFNTAMNNCLETVLNLESTTTVKLLVEYIDGLLKKGGKLSSMARPPEDDFAVEALLEQLIVLYRLIKDKDVFNQYYKRALAGRLLQERSKSEALEQYFVNKIKVQCGARHTREIEVMLQDVAISKDLKDRFEQDRLSPQSPLAHLPSISVRILSEKVWPAYKREEIAALPVELVTSLAAISAFYEKFKGSSSSAASPGSGGPQQSVTKLTWLHNFGRGELQPRYGRFGKPTARPLKLDCNIYQAAILLLFNGADELSLEEIASRLQVDEEFLKKQLMSLCLGKYKALSKATPKAKSIAAGETFRPNEKLPAEVLDRRTRKARPRVAFPVPRSQGEKDADAEKVDREVQEERKYAIEAAVVRTLKANRTMKLQQLVAAVVTQLAYLFKADPKYIRKRINDLMDREFLARDDDDPTLLHYIA